MATWSVRRHLASYFNVSSARMPANQILDGHVADPISRNTRKCCRLLQYLRYSSDGSLEINQATARNYPAAFFAFLFPRPFSSITACAAASRAIGTRKGE